MSIRYNSESLRGAMLPTEHALRPDVYVMQVDLAINVDGQLRTDVDSTPTSKIYLLVTMGYEYKEYRIAINDSFMYDVLFGNILVSTKHKLPDKLRDKIAVKLSQIMNTRPI